MSQIGLLKLREELHNKLLKARSLESILLQPQFERLWEDSTARQQEECKALIVGLDKDGVSRWMRDHPSIDVGEKSVRDLYVMAQRLNIKNYTRLSKEELVATIMRLEASKNGSIQ